MNYDTVLMDIDNTLLDFDAGTKESLTKLLAAFGQELTEQRLARFFEINNALWKAYEHGEIEKSYIFSSRFGQYLGEMGIETDSLAANGMYAKGLSESAVLMPHAIELLEQLKGKVKIYAVTNGVTTTQTPRLEKSGLLPYFDGVFISEQMGCKKPEAEFFDQVFAAIGITDRSRTIILGDSLTSDMQGGRNAGIKTCYFGSDPDDRCDFSIADLTQFPSILGL